MMRRWPVILITAPIVALVPLLAACGGEETTSLPTVTEAGDDTADGSAPQADCGPEAMSAAVSAELDPDGSIPGTVAVQQCQGGYARIFYEPEAANLESEQVFLVDTGGDWAVLTYGTGIDCATETDWRPAQLEDACVALGLR